MNYHCFKENYKMISVDLSKRQALDADPREIQQIYFTGNLDRLGNAIMFLSYEEAKETVLEISQQIVKVLQVYCTIN